MSDEPKRCFLTEAKMIINGETSILPEKRHLEVLVEWHEVSLIRIANEIEEMKRRVQEMP